jgi:shikimate kinase
MGSGKSTIGPILANTLGFEYLDVDHIIERTANKRVAEIFETDGEAAFRAMERDALTALKERTHCVIALGGGTIANEENYRLVAESGILVYLKLSAEEILERVRHKNDRPLLKDEKGNLLSPAELEQRVAGLLGKREQYYSRADIIIDADRKRVGVTVDEIMNNLRGLLKE